VVPGGSDPGRCKAQYNLGLCYLHGEGVPRNMAVGIRWLQKARKQRHASAKRVLENLVRREK
jgi:TPR repeat protein